VPFGMKLVEHFNKPKKRESLNDDGTDLFSIIFPMEVARCMAVDKAGKSRRVSLLEQRT
jgi:hypothetical protein